MAKKVYDLLSSIFFRLSNHAITKSNNFYQQIQSIIKSIPYLLLKEMPKYRKSEGVKKPRWTIGLTEKQREREREDRYLMRGELVRFDQKIRDMAGTSWCVNEQMRAEPAGLKKGQKWTHCHIRRRRRKEGRQNGSSEGRGEIRMLQPATIKRLGNE